MCLYVRPAARRLELIRTNDKIDKALINFCMIREAFLKALVPCTIITFCGIMTLMPLYVTLGVLNRYIIEKSN